MRALVTSLRSTSIAAALALSSVAAIAQDEPVLGVAIVEPAGVEADAFATPESTARFLTQATFGANRAELAALTGTDVSDWLAAEFAKPATSYLAPLLEVGERNVDVPRDAASEAIWNAMIAADDQLRQRMAFALSQIFVVSTSSGPLFQRPLTSAAYMDVLSRNALGNYRDLLEDVTYSYAMGLYLTYHRNRKADPETGRVPDENYAREIMQLFSIGLVELELDGAPRLENGAAVETYTNEDITGLAKVFTGLSRKAPTYKWNDAAPDSDHQPMNMFDEQHSMAEKSFLGHTIPANTPGEDSIDQALDVLFTHPNVAPFVSRQLIQRFITSHPSPDYVRRVAQTFETGAYRLPNGQVVGAGDRGDLKATLAAILLDEEARAPGHAAAPTFGKVREPVLRFVQWARAFDVSPVNAANESWLRNTYNPSRLGQHPLKASSVFNFYRPGFVAPGTATGAAGLTAPELQISNETTMTGYANFMSEYVRGGAPTVDRLRRGMTPDYGAELALADDPVALVEHLNLLLTYGRLQDDTRARILELLETVRGDEQRVHLAVLLVATSPEYIVQR